MRAYTFGPFVLFPDRFVLVRNGAAQQLTPRLLSVLHYLIKHRNRVVTKEELLAEVWRGTFIEEGIVGRTVSTLRALLGDVAERPIYIQTVSRVGYRFVHSVNIQYPDAAGEGFVGRANEIAFLHDCLARCEQGSSSIVCVSGAAGIGKTALCERLLSDVEGRAEVLRSRCAPHLSTTESYGPFIDAFAHRISIPVPPKTANLDRRFAAAVTEASRKRPLVLFIDDFHWADRASADLIGFLSLHLAAVRMLLVVTLRPTEILRLRHPFGPIHQELQVKGACHSLPLNLLSLDEMAQYLDIAAPVSDDKEKLLNAVYKHSEGNPLFMISALRHLKTSGALCQSGGLRRGTKRSGHSDGVMRYPVSGTQPAVFSCKGPEWERGRDGATSGNRLKAPPPNRRCLFKIWPGCRPTRALGYA